MQKIKRAIISVSDKTGLVDLVKTLAQKNVEIFSTGGTLRTIREAGLEAQSIENYTNFPEMLDGRVKTLHPKIHGGILGIRENESHQDSMKAHDILPFDLVIINLYPFENVIKKENVAFEDVVENIDIGGPTLIRSAAKNYRYVAVLVDPSQYSEFINRFNENEGALSEEFRFELMKDAFIRTSSYDSVISNYMIGLQGETFPEQMSVAMKKESSLRYGENPHQQAGFYLPILSEKPAWNKLHGKELSYNNLIDVDIAIRVAKDFSMPVCAIFKHTNPCGISIGDDMKQNLKRAMATDPVSYFGGIVSMNREVNSDTAEIMANEFLEIIIAPKFSSEALEILTKKKNIRLLEIPDLSTLHMQHYEIKSSAGGFLLQEVDLDISQQNEFTVVTDTKPDDALLFEMEFAFRVVKYIKSNAIVFTKNGQTLGIGAGQMSRIDSIRFAIEKARMAGLDLEGSVLASDAFFPFRDGVDLAIEAKIAGIVQPGGSMRDAESILAANESKLPMVFTGKRHFRH